MTRIFLFILMQLLLHPGYSQAYSGTWNGDGDYLPGSAMTTVMKKMGAEKKLVFDINTTGNVTGNLITTFTKKAALPHEGGDQYFTMTGKYDPLVQSLLLILTHLKTKPDYSDSYLTFRKPDSVYYDLSLSQEDNKTVITGTASKKLNTNTTAEWVGSFNGGGLGMNIAENVSMHVLPLRIKFEYGVNPLPFVSNSNAPVAFPDTVAVAVRKIEIQRTIILDTSLIKIELYDNGEIDGDIATLILDGKTIINKQLLSAKPATISLTLSKTTAEHTLELFADNQGTIPPNTALVVLSCNNKRYEINLSSNEKTNGSVKMIFKKN